VLAIACSDAARWQRDNETPLRVAVNVTARQFRHKGFVTSVKNALDESGLDPRLLELEIIENAIMDHGVETVAALDAIGKMGVLLAIDDFGTGYSSLSYLRRLPIDSVKIDQSFVADLPDDPGARAIVGSIIALAHNLGLEVLAEGVETQAQCTYLRQRGCDRGQGFLFGRPQAVELRSAVAKMSRLG
jgi:EAL domain-containing protein (putative c-di-GMP-specific phosphodiesterase class I)